MEVERFIPPCVPRLYGAQSSIKLRLYTSSRAYGHPLQKALFNTKKLIKIPAVTVRRSQTRAISH